MSDPYNEPAFPIRGALVDHQFTGLTLRDYFAAKAMQALLSSSNDVESRRFLQKSEDPYAVFTERAYLMADAMLKARAE